jgi:hypothetical protein
MIKPIDSAKVISIDDNVDSLFYIHQSYPWQFAAGRTYTLHGNVCANLNSWPSNFQRFVSAGRIEKGSRQGADSFPRLSRLFFLHFFQKNDCNDINDIV